MEKKNKRKSLGRWTSLVLTFMFIGSWAVLGVALALAGTGYNVGGTISFSTQAIEATVSKVSLTGVTAADGKLQTIQYKKGTKAADVADAEASWSGLTFEFEQADEPSDIVLTFSIKNDSADKALHAKIGDMTIPTTQGLSTSVEVTYDEETKTNGEDFTIASGETATVTITFKVTNADIDIASTNWSVAVALSNAEITD